MSSDEKSAGEKYWVKVWLVHFYLPEIYIQVKTKLGGLMMMMILLVALTTQMVFCAMFAIFFTIETFP